MIRVLIYFVSYIFCRFFFRIAFPTSRWSYDCQGTHEIWNMNKLQGRHNARWRLKSPASWLFTQPFIEAQIKENIKGPRHWPLWSTVNSPHKGPLTRKMFLFDDIIMIQAITCWQVRLSDCICAKTIEMGEISAPIGIWYPWAMAWPFLLLQPQYWYAYSVYMYQVCSI